MNACVVGVECIGHGVLDLEAKIPHCRHGMIL